MQIPHTGALACAVAAAPLLQSRSHMRRNDAKKLWRKLQDQGWKQVEPQWGIT